MVSLKWNMDELRQPRWMNKYLGGPYGVWALIGVSTVGLYYWHRMNERERVEIVTEDQRSGVDDTTKFADAVKPFSGGSRG